jgi:hypothetical protein
MEKGSYPVYFAGSTDPSISQRYHVMKFQDPLSEPVKIQVFAFSPFFFMQKKTTKHSLLSVLTGLGWDGHDARGGLAGGRDAGGAVDER